MIAFIVCGLCDSDWWRMVRVVDLDEYCVCVFCVMSM